MKVINYVTMLFVVIMGIITIGINIYIMNLSVNEGRPYWVEGNRIEIEIEKGNLNDVNLSDYNYIVNVVKYSGNNDFYSGDNRDYFIKEIDNELYRFDYINDSKDYNNKLILGVNTALIIITIIIVTFMLYIKYKILKPFNTLSEMPYQISRGNLTSPLNEHKGKIFGRFVWGINLLRENVEERKKNELALQKEKKTLILSISHDIKTPLSAIKLYSKALSTDLYKEKEKQLEVAENINSKADEIESFVSQIIKASSEDFLKLQVTEGEFYFSHLIDNITRFYAEKLKLLKIEFMVHKSSNCLLIGDIDRAIEVMQNIIENAIKYGDGKKIELSFSNEEDCRLITVTNSGCTLPENDLPHVFDSFWRGSNIGNNGGSGLGLYICRQLMGKMNGDIFLAKNNDNISVTAVFRLA